MINSLSKLRIQKRLLRYTKYLYKILSSFQNLSLIYTVAKNDFCVAVSSIFIINNIEYFYNYCFFYHLNLLLCIPHSYTYRLSIIVRVPKTTLDRNMGLTNYKGDFRNRVCAYFLTELLKSIF